MNYALDKKDQFSIIKLNIEKLDSLSAPEFKSELVKLNSGGEKNIIIDLSAVKYVDSSGLSAILVGNRLCAGSEGKLILAGINSHVEKLLKISQLDGVLEALPTVEEAEDHMYLDNLEKNLKADAEEGSEEE